jgi:hypothetical protein
VSGVLFTVINFRVEVSCSCYEFTNLELVIVPLDNALQSVFIMEKREFALQCK